MRPVNQKIGATIPPPNLRIGHGFDMHAFKAGRPFWLGGVKMPGDGLDGYSDADVVLHAIGNAILGALNLGDLGTHFPPGDTKWKSVRSTIILQKIVEMMQQRKHRILNLDVSIIAEKPKISPNAERMKTEISQALGIEMSQVNVKASTPEKLGALGRGEGIACHVVVLLFGEVPL